MRLNANHERKAFKDVKSAKIKAAASATCFAPGPRDKGRSAKLLLHCHFDELKEAGDQVSHC